MTNFNPRPFPWTLDIGDSSHRYSRIISDDGYTVHYMYSTGDYKSYEREISNARLMWSAPEMLAALEEVAKAEKALASTITTSTKMQVLISAKALRLAKAAIAKAKGA